VGRELVVEEGSDDGIAAGITDGVIDERASLDPVDGSSVDMTVGSSVGVIIELVSDEGYSLGVIAGDSGEVNVGIAVGSPVGDAVGSSVASSEGGDEDIMEISGLVVDAVTAVGTAVDSPVGIDVTFIVSK